MNELIAGLLFGFILGMIGGWRMALADKNKDYLYKGEAGMVVLSEERRIDTSLLEREIADARKELDAMKDV